MESLFSNLNLPTALLTGLSKMGFTQPTEIQEQAMGPALEGSDLFASAQTGSGKTLAYLLPAIVQIQKNPTNAGTVLVLTPTRELAEQVLKVVKDVCTASGLNIRSCLLIGGTSMMPQLRNLQKGPQMIVGTPGRIMDHLRRGSLKLKTTQVLILDECDRMLDMGFLPQIQTILRETNPNRQTLLFSATLPPEIESLARGFMKNPKRAGVSQKFVKPPTEIVQSSIQTSQDEKPKVLLKQIADRPGKTTIVFTRTKHRSDRLSKLLSQAGIRADRIHGGRNQRQRSAVLNQFRDGQISVLVATDVAARGLDIPNVGLVVNFDLPQSPEDFVHRLGRTGRAGASGEAISFVSQDEGHLWRSIQNFIAGKPGGGGGGSSHSGGPRRGGGGGGGRFSRGGGRKGPSRGFGGGSGPRRGGNSSGGGGSRTQGYVSKSY